MERIQSGKWRQLESVVENFWLPFESSQESLRLAGTSRSGKLLAVPSHLAVALQFINHIPKGSSICRKDNLVRYLRCMRKVYGTVYDFRLVQDFFINHKELNVVFSVMSL